MVTKQYRSLGFDLSFEVPGTVDEFNSNAWKQDTQPADGNPNPCLSEAINNIIYRGSLAEFRNTFLHGRKEDAEKGITAIVGVEDATEIPRLTKEVKGKDGSVRMKDGEPVTTFDESEDRYYNRVLATLVKNGKYASEDLAHTSFEPLAKQVAGEIKFDAAAKEKTFAGPKKLAAKYKLTAARIIAAGTITKANTNYLSNIGKEFVPTNDNTKLYKGTYEELDPATKKPTGKTKEVEVSDKDAEALGWLLKEYQDWKAAQEQLAMAE